MKHSTVFTALFLVLLSLSCTGNEEKLKVNILLVLIDTLNADHLGCYGYYRDTSPTIDSLAASGVIFRSCQAQASWTLPGMTSIYTGLSERSHHCGYYDGIIYGLDPEMPTISTILQQHGYSTAAFVRTEFMGNEFGMDKGYDSFWIAKDWYIKDTVTVDTLLNYFGNNEVSEPFLVTIHFYDPHSPYQPPSPYDTYFTSSGTIGGYDDWPIDTDLWNDPYLIAHLEALYDSEIRCADSQLSRLFQSMREMGLMDNTLVILVADHGEEFMEHGDTGHANNLYQQTIHIPLILSGPGIEPGSVILLNAGQFDVLPTVLAYLDIPVPNHVEGINLLGDIPVNRIIPSSGVVGDTSMAACLQETIKLMWFVEPDSFETYDIASDPGEMNVLPTDSLLLEEVLNYWASPSICTPTWNDSLKFVNKLQALGYL